MRRWSAATTQKNRRVAVTTARTRTQTHTVPDSLRRSLLTHARSFWHLILTHTWHTSARRFIGLPGGDLDCVCECVCVCVCKSFCSVGGDPTDMTLPAILSRELSPRTPVERWKAFRILPYLLTIVLTLENFQSVQRAREWSFGDFHGVRKASFSAEALVTCGAPQGD